MTTTAHREHRSPTHTAHHVKERPAVADTDQTTTEHDRVRPFAEFLQEHNRGNTHARLSEDLQTLVRAVVDTGKPGTVQLTIRVEPMKENADVLLVTDKVALKAPEAPRKGSIFFPDAAGNLNRDHPDQEQLPL